MKQIFELVGSPLAVAMQYVFELLYLPRFPETVSMFICIAALSLWIRCCWQTRSLKKRLCICNDKLHATSGADGRATLLASFESEIANSKDPLRDCWNRFRMTLVERDNNQIFQTVSPSLFFNLNSLGLETPLRQFGKWSGLFVGIGLLVTFLGLVAALHSATEAINAATSSGNNGTVAMQEALKDLLKAASFKFYTSIFGLLASLYVSYAEKRMRRKFDTLSRTLCQRLENILPIITPEKLLSEQVYEAKQTTIQLKQFNTEMSNGLITLSGAMDKALRESISPVHHVLQNGFNNTHTKFTEGITSALREHISPVQRELKQGFTNTASVFAETMNSAMQQHIGSVVQGLNQVTLRIESLEQSMGNSIGENLRSMQEQTLDTLAGKLGGVVNDQAGAELRNLTTTLETLVASLAAMTSSLEQGGGSFAETLESAAHELRNGVAGLSQTTENISKSVNRDMSQAQQVLQDRLAALGDELSSRGQAAAVRLTEATHSVVETMQGTVTGLGTQMEYFADSLTQTNAALATHRVAVDEAANQTRSAATTLEKAASILNTSVAPMTTCIRGMDASLKGLQEGALSLGEKVQHASSAIERASTSLEQNWQQHVERFQGIDGELANILQNITNDLKVNTAKVSDYVKEIDQHMGSAVSQFAEGIEELGDILDKHLRSLRQPNQR